MTGRRRTRSTFLPEFKRPARATALAAGALAACASLAVGCGVIPGVTGGSGDDTIKVMTWAPMDTRATNKPGMPAFAQAYARWVNSQGGIDGRKLQVLVCNDHNDTVSAARCAQRAADENVVAVVGSYSQHADAFLPTLESADIPYIGGFGITNSEFDSPLSYPVNGGQPSLLAGLGEELGGVCGPVALVRPDSIAGDELHTMLDSGLQAGRHAAAADQLAAEDATEYSVQSERALGRVTTDPAKKGCVIPALGDRTSTFMDSFRRAREDYPDVRVATVMGSVDQTVIDASGGASGPYEGAYISGWYPPSTDKRWDGMKKVIKEQAFSDNRIDADDTGVQTTWLAYTVLKAVVESIDGGEVTGSAIRRSLDGGLKISTGGLTPTLSWGYDEGLAVIGLPRLVNTDVMLQAVRRGRLVSVTKDFTDVSKTLESADVG
ncbi:ABC transporter substrate-binding protein [Streptomyces sp. NPDC090106]|uniref:ABC transporter substrate-binding protein n=1 Tax=Streptomyces sp. NPDC090106 TaxID=3365946 RepID=UPI0038057A88